MFPSDFISTTEGLGDRSGGPTNRPGNSSSNSSSQLKYRLVEGRLAAEARRKRIEFLRSIPLPFLLAVRLSPSLEPGFAELEDAVEDLLKWRR